MTDLTNLEETDSQREIFNLLYILLSLDLKSENQTSEEIIEWRKVVMDKAVQTQLGRLWAIYCTKYSVNNLSTDVSFKLN